MKIKKILGLVLFCVTNFVSAHIMHHTLISVTEQNVAGHLFKQIISSGHADKDEFFIDGCLSGKDNYYKEYDHALQREREAEIAKQEKLHRDRVEFVEAAQVQIIAKLLDKSIMQASEQLSRVENQSLEKFYLFSDGTIDSLDQLHQLKIFLDQIKNSIKKWVENNDLKGLYSIYNRLEPWPARIEKFFQDTIQYAIKQSDDTVMLKELLKLVSAEHIAI